MLIGIDLGGTKIELIGIDPRNSKELYRHRQPTPRTYEQTLEALISMVQQCETSTGQRGSVGLGIPGIFEDGSPRVNLPNLPWVTGHPLVNDIQSRLNRPIMVGNDANCFALSEAMDGAAQDANVVFGVIIGTGAGAGIVVNKTCLTGIHGSAGEWGHTPLPWPRDDEATAPRRCGCGRHGCLEAYVSGMGFRNDFLHATGRDVSAHDILKLAEDGDGDALMAITRYEDRLARSLAAIINLLDPDVFVFGGGMSQLERLYVNLPPLVAQYTYPTLRHTRFVPARHGAASGVRGAAWLGRK